MVCSAGTSLRFSLRTSDVALTLISLLPVPSGAHEKGEKSHFHVRVEPERRDSRDEGEKMFSDRVLDNGGRSIGFLTTDESTEVRIR